MGMFMGSKFNGDLSKWKVSKVTDMSWMFDSASVFNGDLSKWDVSKVTDMNWMFAKASSFNGDLSKWNPPKNNEHYSMFDGTPCSLCDRVPRRFERQCLGQCFAPTVPVV